MNVMGIIFTNDGNIGELTNKRTMASLPFGGRYRQVDFGLSNLAFAGVRHVGIIARYSYQSLMNHIGDGEEWGLELGEGGLEFLTPYASSINHSYRGKLESLSSNMDFLEYCDDDYVIMIDSTVLSNIDLNKVVADHIASGKDITVVTAKGICNGKKVMDFALKLDKNGQVEDMVCDYAAPAEYQASMDIFVMSRQVLIREVKTLVAKNWFHMDRDLCMGGWRNGKITVNAYQFDGIAMFNESTQEYFEHSLSLVDKQVRDGLFGGTHPIYTKVRDRVPSYYGENSCIENVVVADGCMLDGSVKNSVLFRQVSIAEGSSVENCVIMNDSVIGPGCQLKNVILDKNVTVTPGTKLFGTKANPIVIKRGEIV
ncbi:MAG: glucose-1-phosphate adenylyltransferase subunit GlgD [Faecousia sp.]